MNSLVSSNNFSKKSYYLGSSNIFSLSKKGESSPTVSIWSTLSYQKAFKMVRAISEWVVHLPCMKPTDALILSILYGPQSLPGVSSEHSITLRVTRCDTLQKLKVVRYFLEKKIHVNISEENRCKYSQKFLTKSNSVKH